MGKRTLARSLVAMVVRFALITTAKRWVLTFVVAAGLNLTGGSAEADSVFYFTSSPASWIGQGQTQTFTAPQNPVTAYRYGILGAYSNAVEFDAGGYSLVIVAPGLSSPTVGFYGNATRWPFMGSGAGMAFTGPGRANNTLTGYFSVLQADYLASGQIGAFAVDFFQLDEGFASWWGSGSIRYNSSIPIPEPGTALLVMTGLLGIAYRQRRHGLAA